MIKMKHSLRSVAVSGLVDPKREILPILLLQRLMFISLN